MKSWHIVNTLYFYNNHSCIFWQFCLVTTVLLQFHCRQKLQGISYLNHGGSIFVKLNWCEKSNRNKHCNVKSMNQLEFGGWGHWEKLLCIFSEPHKQDVSANARFYSACTTNNSYQFSFLILKWKGHVFAFWESLHTEETNIPTAGSSPNHDAFPCLWFTMYCFSVLPIQNVLTLAVMESIEQIWTRERSPPCQPRMCCTTWIL